MFFAPQVGEEQASREGQQGAEQPRVPVGPQRDAPAATPARQRSRTRSSSGSSSARARLRRAERRLRRERARTRAAVAARADARREAEEAAATGPRARALVRYSEGLQQQEAYRATVAAGRERGTGAAGADPERRGLRVALEVAAVPVTSAFAAAPRAVPSRTPAERPRPSSAPVWGETLGVYQHNRVWVTATQLAEGRPGLPDPPRYRPDASSPLGYFL